MTERYAIISDIHGNAEALQAVLAEARRLGAEKICCLGDIVGYGASAAECLALVRDNCEFIIRGNHDAQVLPPRHPDMREEAVQALEYTASILPPADTQWLQELPDVLIPDDQFVICHGALTNGDDYILSTDAALTNLMLLEKRFPGKNVVFFGHTHLPMALTKTGVKMDFTAGGRVAVDPTKSYLCNPGSVGQPRDRTPEACLIVYDVFQGQMLWKRVPYAVAIEQEKMRNAGLAEKSWQRLALGR